MMVAYLRVDPEDVLKALEDTRGCHARFAFLKKLYVHHLATTAEDDGDDAQVMHHRACALISYLMYLVVTSIFGDNNAYYVDVVYLIYLIDFERVHEYN